MKTGAIAVALPLAVLTAAGSTLWKSAQAVDANELPLVSASAVLALLPDGEEKRRFVLDCTGCHQMEVSRAFPGGRARSRDEWQAIIDRMLTYAGWQSSFPVISAGRDSKATAAWLATHWDRAPRSDLESRAETIAADIREYSYPHADDLPHDLAVDGNGQVIVTGMFTHKMLVLNPADGTYRDISIPVPDANPRAVDLDEDGNWWVLLGAPMRAARYRPEANEWQTWSIGLYGHSIRPDAQGRAWFNGHFTKTPVQLGYVDTASGVTRVFDAPGSAPEADGGGPIPYGLRIAPDGSAWMTELAGNRLLRLDPVSGVFRIWSMPTPHSGPRRLAVDNVGVVWIPLYAAGSLARFDLRTETFKEYALPIADALPYVVEIDASRGRVWIGTGAADAVFLFDAEHERFRVVRLPTRGALVRHIDVDRRTGDLWAAYGASPGVRPAIARIRVTP